MVPVEWHVLVVDDDRELQSEVEGWLKSNDIRVTTASDGAAALKLLNDGLQPDAILSDIKMPKKDGFEFLDAVRANESWNWIRFVFLVDSDDQAFLKHADDMGIDSYLLKPFGKKELLYTVLDGVKNPKGERASARAGQPIVRDETGEFGKLNTIPDTTTGVHRAASPYNTASTSTSVASEILGYGRVLGRHKWVILITMLAALGAAVFITNQTTPMYESQATVRIVTAPTGVEQDLYSVANMAVRLLNTYSEIVTSGPVLDELADRMDLQEAPDVSVEIVPDSELLRISVMDPDPQIAADAVNTLTEIMQENSLKFYTGDTKSAREILEEQVNQAEADYEAAVQAYETGIDEGQTEEQLAALQRRISVYEDQYTTLLQRYESIRIEEQLRANGVNIVEPGYVPDNPVSPNRPLNLILGLAGGLVAGLLIAFVLESFDNTVRDTNEVERISGMSVLTKLPNTTSRLPLRRKSAPLLANTHSVSADAYRQLMVRLRIHNVLAERGSILVTSPEKGSGKTTVVANLGLSLARAGYATILIDGDFRSPGLHTMFNLSNKRGLAEVLRSDQPLTVTLQNTGYKNLRVMTAGNSPVDLSEIASPEQISAVLGDLLKDCEYLIIDSPSVLAVADAAVLAALTDAVVLVASQRHTTREAFRLALQYLDEIQANVLGVVVNRIPMALLSKYYQHDRKVVAPDNSHAVSKVSS